MKDGSEIVSSYVRHKLLQHLQKTLEKTRIQRAQLADLMGMLRKFHKEKTSTAKNLKEI